MKTTQPWLANPVIESVFIILPMILPVAAVLIFRDYFTTHEVSTLWWVILVLCIDVSHVYSTLFRLYWDRQTFQAHKRLLVIIPIVGFFIAIGMHLYDAMLFWRILAYIAVFHFVRQQYGFMRLYARKETHNKWRNSIDAIAIYTATLYPLLHWHMVGTDKIAWFVKGDFLRINLDSYDSFLAASYYVVIGIYVIKELVMVVKLRSFNIPKNLIIAGTFLSWYFGIVAFQGDLIFTLLNVVAHGIPYMALIWIYGAKKTSGSFTFGIKGALTFVAVLLMLAYFEENLWDNFVWNDHPGVFIPLADGAIENPYMLSCLVALLILPQVTHYVLDGFIWRFSKDPHSRF
ncbi:MAG TPA: hypothetical protein VD884_11215 [Ohtaekwangia sp.]|nr:hypothetical protein [Ohtaekwangia sp.]